MVYSHLAKYIGTICFGGGTTLSMSMLPKRSGWLGPILDLSMCGSKDLYVSVFLQTPMSVKALIIFVL